MRNGFTMVELIFTILILAVTTMAIPRMVAQTAELNVFAIKQELVMNAKTVLTQIAKVPWDSAYKYEKCTTNPAATVDERKANANTCLEPTSIHRIPNGNLVLNQRVGIVRDGEERIINNSDPVNAPIGESNFGFGARNDIDNYNGYNNVMNPVVDAAGANTSGDFLLTTNINVVVGFVPDVLTIGNYANSTTISANLATATTNVPSNIKMIQITATDNADPARSVVLRTYSFNIGASSIRDTTL